MVRKFLLILAFYSVTIFGQRTESGDYKLLWSDDFSASALDTSKWKTRDWEDNGAGAAYPITAKPSISLTRNVQVKNGNLELHFKKEIVDCGMGYNSTWGRVINNLDNDFYCTFQQKNGNPYAFSGAEVVSKTAYENSYGYYEARVKMPYKFGVWNSFWTFRGDQVPNSENAGEIDIFETLGRFGTEDLIKTNVHLTYCTDDNPGGFSFEGVGNKDSCGYYGTGNLCEGKPSYDRNVCTEDYTQWHTYGLELTPDFIIWYIDDVKVREMINPGVHTDLWVEFGIVGEPNYFSQDKNDFDVMMEVDYFRFYEAVQPKPKGLENYYEWF